jgi:hypothetical protein
MIIKMLQGGKEFFNHYRHGFRGTRHIYNTHTAIIRGTRTINITNTKHSKAILPLTKN